MPKTNRLIASLFAKLPHATLAGLLTASGDDVPPLILTVCEAIRVRTEFLFESCWWCLSFLSGQQFLMLAQRVGLDQHLSRELQVVNKASDHLQSQGSGAIENVCHPTARADVGF